MDKRRKQLSDNYGHPTKRRVSGGKYFPFARKCARSIKYHKLSIAITHTQQMLEIADKINLTDEQIQEYTDRLEELQIKRRALWPK